MDSTRGFSSVLGYFLLYILLLMVAAFFSSLIPNSDLFEVGISSLLAFMVFIGIRYKESISTSYIRYESNVHVVPLSLLFLLAVVSIVMIPVIVRFGLPKITLNSSLWRENIFKAVLVGVYGAFKEELFFRSFFIDLFKKYGHGTMTSILFSSILFGLLHFGGSLSLSTLLFISSLGFMLGLVRFLTKGILLPMGLHFLYNFIGGVLSFGEKPFIYIEGFEQIDSSYHNWVGVVLFSLLSIYLYRRLCFN